MKDDLARYYDSRTGTFCSADTVAGSPGDPQSWNRYPHGRNDPIDITDPSGKSWWSSLLIDVGVAVAAYFAPVLAPELFGDAAAGTTVSDVAMTTSTSMTETGSVIGISSGASVTVSASIDPLATGLFGGAMAAGIQAGNTPQTPQTPKMKDCPPTNAHGVQNNLPTRAPNRPGSYGVPETPGTSAIDRSQWLPSGSSNWTSAQANAYINQYRSQISGYVPNGNGGYTQVFNGVSDNMGPASGVANLTAKYPGRVLFELPGGKDLGNMNNMRFRVPSKMPCPHP